MVAVRRLIDKPIIHPELFALNGGDNINGPSLISAPDWLSGRLGNFYLYFAHHNGTYIRLAYADRLEGPWTLYQAGTLQLAEAKACHDHIASPDVHVDYTKKEFIMYFHGVVLGTNQQRTFLARSKDGLTFDVGYKPLADFYLRAVRWGNYWIGMSKGGVMYISESMDGDYRQLPNPAFPMRHPQGNAPGDVRHVALKVLGNSLQIYYSKIGDMPEKIYRATVDLTKPIENWIATNCEIVMIPERPWEGCHLPLTRSKAGRAPGPENALRDPAIFTFQNRTYLLYSAAGESSIGIAELID